MNTLNKSEEKLKWRQDEDGETEANSPTLLSRARDIQNGISTKPVINYFVTLAESSPGNSNTDESDYYDSIHSHETAYCQSSTDSDSSSSAASFTTEEIATVDVVEYEVASASDGNSFSNNSSSGTDDHGFIMAAALTARTVCDTSSSTSEFADSEESESDKLFDTELTAADYWKCIQCKNSQNNPLFRMCEKCYKTRRTHFPPRPKIRKKRLNRNSKTPIAFRANHSSSATTELSSSYTNEPVSSSQNDEVSKRLSNNAIIGNDGLKTKFKNCSTKYKKLKLNYTNNNISQLNSAAETSGDNSSDIDVISNRKRKSPLRIKREIISTNQSSSGQSNLSANRLENSINRKRKASLNNLPNENDKQSRLTDSTSIITKIETTSDTDDLPLTNVIVSQKDSGISSVQSSQEPTSSSQFESQSAEKDEFLVRCSQETVCDELDPNDLIELQNEEIISEQSTPAAVIGSPLSSSITTEHKFSDTNNSNLIRSISDCSSTFLNNNLAADSSFTMNVNSLESNFSSYGSCIICLQGPKNGVFVHSNLLHLCSCYKCAVKIWTKYKRCPVCNSSVKNVLKLFVH